MTAVDLAECPLSQRSSPGVRLLAKQATEAAVRKSKDSRAKPAETEEKP